MRPSRFEVDVLATSAFLDLDELLGKPLALRLARADGQRRRWHRLCTAVAPLGGDGGLARYRLLIEPWTWTALLMHRRKALVFQDLDLHGCWSSCSPTMGFLEVLQVPASAQAGVEPQEDLSRVQDDDSASAPQGEASTAQA